MIFGSYFFIYFLFTKSAAEEDTTIPTTLDAYITYVESNPPDGVNSTLEASLINTNETHAQKKKRLIYQLYKNSLLKQREQREKDAKMTLHHRKRRSIGKLEVEKTTLNATPVKLIRETEKFGVDETMQNATKVQVSRETKKSGVEETTQNATKIQLSRELIQYVTPIELSRETEKLIVEETTQNVTTMQLSKRMYIPMRIARFGNNANNSKSKNALRQLNLEAEKAKDKSKKAFDDVIRLRSVNITTTGKKATHKIGRRFETMKDMIRYKRRSSLERRALQQHSQ